MKKKSILLVLCAVLLLIFTSSSYAGFDPNYVEREEGDPWEHKSSPELDDNQEFNLILLVANPGSFLMFRFPSKVVGPASPQGLLDRKESSPEFQEAKSK